MNGKYKYYQHGLIYSGAPHTESHLSDKESRELLKNHRRAWFVRNVYDWDCAEQTSFWYIIQDKPILLEDLHAKCRNQVRRSIKELDISIINGKEWYDDLYRVYISAFSRYKVKTSVPLSKDEWINHLQNTKNQVDIWGAFEKETGELIAFAEVLIQSNAAKYTALKAIPEKMSHSYPFYGLLFEMNRHYIEESDLLYVTDGARSITEHSNIQSFLEKFNFRKAYCRLNVTYVWWLGFIVIILYPLHKYIAHGKLGYLLRFEAVRRNEY